MLIHYFFVTILELNFTKFVFKYLYYYYCLSIFNLIVIFYCFHFPIIVLIDIIDLQIIISLYFSFVSII